MADKLNTPATLMEVIKHFSDTKTCIDFAAQLRWPEGNPICPVCAGDQHYWLDRQFRWKCKSCKKQFSVKVGTIFEDSPLGLDKWLCAMWMIGNCKNGISSYEIHRDLGITQKSAWFMMHRIRYAMQTGTFRKLSGEVEIDESFIGGKSRNMHKDVRARKVTGTGGKDKTIALGMVERNGEVRTMVVANRRKGALQAAVREHVEAGSAIFSDELKSYDGLATDYQHAVINHAVEYVNENVHTNTMENFWSLVKRQLHGTYISVEPFHLFRYLDEQAFRYNNRHKGITDADRFCKVLSNVGNRRLTYRKLTGKVENQTV